MNCHKDNNTDKHKYGSHIIHMLLCCGLPILIVGIIPIVATFSRETSRILSSIVPFLCPIMMLSMIPMMFAGRKKDDCCNQESGKEK